MARFMDVSYLRKYLGSEVSAQQRYLWLGLSLLVSLSYSIPVLFQSFSYPYLMQDDARQHVFWMQRFVDPELFPNDLLADYFQSVAPWGYSTLYWLASQIGFDPVVFNKLLPPVLLLITTVYTFLGAMQFLPSPVAAFISATLINQNLWLRDDVVSGTPVAFVYPLFTAFLYYMMRRSLFPYLGAIVLMGLFYPQMVLISSGILFMRLFTIKNYRLGLTSASELRFYLLGIAVSVGIMLPYVLEPSVYGPILTRAEAQDMATLGNRGWSRFFRNHFTRFWACGKRSGFLPPEWCDISFALPQLGLGLMLPLVIWGRQRFTLAQRVSPEALVVPQALIVSLCWFFVAHALVFRLHLPNRYGEHSIRIVMAVSAGVALVIAWDRVMKWLVNRQSIAQSLRAFAALAGASCALTILLVNPYQLEFDRENFPIDRYAKGIYPEVYEYLSAQPKDILVASLSPEVNNLPSFAKRSVLVGGGGFVLPYHTGYFQQVEERLLENISAQYAPQLDGLKQFIEKYGVDYWLIDHNFTDLTYLSEDVFFQFPIMRDRLIQRLGEGRLPALARVAPNCVVVEVDNVKPVKLLDAACILEQ
ncbi:hypothetical protein IQ267_17975 [filamentous cyanobacterium LEGE 07170]|nr:hypothetical protein [filamentous cyanobacterium LEGE 07170]